MDINNLKKRIEPASRNGTGENYHYQQHALLRLMTRAEFAATPASTLADLSALPKKEAWTNHLRNHQDAEKKVTDDFLDRSDVFLDVLILL